MPILMLAIVALVVFFAMGIMLLSATVAERRDRGKRTAAAASESRREGDSKAKAARA
jgi:hypothetical protein